MTWGPCRLARAVGVAGLVMTLMSSGLIFSTNTGASVATPMEISRCVNLGGNTICGNPSWIASAEAAYSNYQSALAADNAKHNTAAQDHQAADNQEQVAEAATEVASAALATYQAAKSATAKAADLKALNSADSAEAAAEALYSALLEAAAEADAIATAGDAALSLAFLAFAVFL